MIDKNYCMSSFLTFRYIVDDNVDYKEGVHHLLYKEISDDKKIIVKNVQDVANAYKKLLSEKQKTTKVGLLLSGGMDSACVAAFLKPGTDAYTFKFSKNNKLGQLETERAIKYAKKYNLKLHFVNLTFDTLKKHLKVLTENKGSPAHSIEPELMEACLQAKKDGIEQIICPNRSDVLFGGMNKILSKDWDFDEFIKFYTFLNPEKILVNPVDMTNIYEKFKIKNNKFDFKKFLLEVLDKETTISHVNAVQCAKMKYKEYFDPSAYLILSQPYDLVRIRSGDSKYIMRELFRLCYPEYEVPEKIPNPRDVDFYFADWKGPTRDEFKKNIDISHLTGDQKWMLFSLEYLLNIFFD